MSIEKIRRQVHELRDLLRPPASPVFASGIVEDGELRSITVDGVEYLRHPGEQHDEFHQRICLEVSGKPLIVFSQATDDSPPLVIFPGGHYAQTHSQ